MRTYPEDEDDQKELAKLNAEPWMVAHLKLNPGYVHWGPGEDYMSAPNKPDGGWGSSIEMKSWKEMYELDELNECVNFYFELDRASEKCPACKDGYSKEARRFHDEWYGYAPFDPVKYGATPLTVEHPAIQEFALRHTQQSPEYYGSGPQAVAREARRVFDLWKGQWAHNLIQADVDALVAADRLWDLTRSARTEEQRAIVKKKIEDGGNSWLPESNGHRPTADEVNAWSIGGFGHDGINMHVCLRARCEREGVELECSECKGAAFRYTAPSATLNLVLWMLVPRKGASRGIRILNLSKDDAAAARAWLRGAAERNAARFAKLAEI